MSRKSLAVAAVAAGLAFAAGCTSPCDRPLLTRLGLGHRADRCAAETCSQPCEGPVLDDCGPPVGPPAVVVPSPNLPPVGPPPRLVPTPQPPDMPYAPPGVNGY